MDVLKFSLAEIILLPLISPRFHRCRRVRIPCGEVLSCRTPRVLELTAFAPVLCGLGEGGIPRQFGRVVLAAVEVCCVEDGALEVCIVRVLCGYGRILGSLWKGGY